MAGRLRIAVEDRKILIPVDEAIRNDLHSLTRRTTESGAFGLAASRAEGHHADRFWAAALALHAADAAGLGGGTAAVPVRVGKWCREGTW